MSLVALREHRTSSRSTAFDQHAPEAALERRSGEDGVDAVLEQRGAGTVR
jgi:hypothetical protein